MLFKFFNLLPSETHNIVHFKLYHRFHYQKLQTKVKNINERQIPS